MKTLPKPMTAIAVAIAFIALAAFAPTTKSSSAATLAAAAWQKDFSLVYCWGTTDFNDIDAWCPCANLTLTRRPKSVDVFDCATGNYYADAGTWEKTRRWETVTFDFGTVSYTGTKLPDGTYQGMMITSTGLMGVWEGEFLP